MIALFQFLKVYFILSKLTKAYWISGTISLFLVFEFLGSYYDIIISDKGFIMFISLFRKFSLKYDIYVKFLISIVVPLVHYSDLNLLYRIYFKFELTPNNHL